MSKPNRLLEISVFLYGPAILPSPPLHSSCSNQRQDQMKLAIMASLASSVCEFRQNSPCVDTLCVWCGLMCHWPSNLRIWLSPEGQMSVRSKSYFSTSLVFSHRAGTEHSAMVGGNTPLHLSLGDTEMGMLVNQPAGWGDCFLKANKCHEERSLCSAKSVSWLHEARYERDPGKSWFPPI